MRDRFLCAAESRTQGEEIFGTVARVRSWFLLEYPGAWRRDAIKDSRLISAAARSRIATLAERSLLIRRDHRRTEEHLQCFFVRSDDPPSMSRALIRDYDDVSALTPGGEIATNLMFAVCTHGRHDRCCAKFGIPVSCAFRDLAPDRAWQCSHIGGDRFAGNVVVFPYGIYYGRVTPEDVPEIIRLSEAGLVWMPGYRGRSCYPRAVQIADYFARRESGRLRIDEFSPVDRSGLASGATRVRLLARSDGSVHVVEFTTHTDCRLRLTCHADEESPAPQYRLTRYAHSS